MNMDSKQALSEHMEYHDDDAINLILDYKQNMEDFDKWNTNIKKCNDMIKYCADECQSVQFFQWSILLWRQRIQHIENRLYFYYTT